MSENEKASVKGQERTERMKYISERIINMSECESLLSTMCDIAYQINKTLEEENPSIEIIKNHSLALMDRIAEIKEFKFIVERRTTY